MKKIAMLILFLLVLSSCAEDAEFGFSDIYLITAMARDVALEDGTEAVPARFNPATGELTTLCTDPLCSHEYGVGCQFEGCGGNTERICVSGDNIYFVARRDTEGGFIEDLCKYDITSASSKVVVSYDTLVGYLPDDTEPGVAEYSLKMGYYYISLDDGDTHERAVMLRYDTKTGALDELDAKFDVTYDAPSFEYDGGYIYDGSDGYYFADNPDGRDRELLFSVTNKGNTSGGLLDRGILVYTTVNGDTAAINLLDLKAKTSRVLIECYLDTYVTACGDYLYLCQYEKEPPEMGYDANAERTIYNRTGGKLWRVDIKSGELELLFEEADYRLDPYSVKAVGRYITVGYNNTDYDDFTVDSGVRGTFYDYKSTVGWMVYDTETGTHAVYSGGDAFRGVM